MRELSDDECNRMAQEVFGYPCQNLATDNSLIRAGYAAGYRAAQEAMPPREPTPAMLYAGMIDKLLHGLDQDIRVVMWRAMHDAWTREQTSGPGVPCESPRSGVSATTSAADGNVGTEDATSGAGRIGRIAPGPLDHQSAATPSLASNEPTRAAQAVTDDPAADPQNGVQRDAASPGCAFGASSLESGNAREATCLSSERDARRGSPTQQEQLGTNAGSTPATPTDPIADLCAELRATHCSNENLHDTAADALERLARERDEVRSMLQAANRDAAKLATLVDKYKWQVRDTCARAERAEAERDTLRAIVRAADAMRKREITHDGNTVGCVACVTIANYDRARAAWKGKV